MLDFNNLSKQGDYHCTKDEIVISNPGSMQISINEAISGGKSDPRNTTLFKMFNLINIGERAGSGIPNIHAVWGQYSHSKRKQKQDI